MHAPPAWPSDGWRLPCAERPYREAAWVPAQPLWDARKPLCTAFRAKAAEGGNPEDMVDGVLPEWLEVSL